LTTAGIPLAAGSDSPYGRPTPWVSMQAAVDRQTRCGTVIGEIERLCPEQALGLYTGPLNCPGQVSEPIAEGAVADLCMLDRPWAQARKALGHTGVMLTLKAGRPIWASGALGKLTAEGCQ